MLKTDGLYFKDEHGRTVMLRGVNLGGSTKLPVHPNGATHLHHNFYQHKAVSFVGRPFAPPDADEHFERLRHWGFNVLRFLITWEAIEHAGPGLYDLIYLDYVKKMVEKAGEYGFFVFIDPHQDVWSRWTGGDGAPGWTLEKVGFKLENLHATGAAFSHQEFAREHGPDTPCPRMIWPTNYSKMACATMWTLFFGGNRFAPNLKIDDVPVQDYLQSHYINAVKQVAERVKEMPHVIGYDTLNEPSHGYIGVKDLTDAKWGMFQNGPSPSVFQGMAAAGGYSPEVGRFEVGRTGIKQSGTVTLNPNGLTVWQDGAELVWQAHGVWAVENGQPVLKQPDYFGAADFAREHMGPFIEKFTAEVRAIHPNALIFAETALNQLMPKLELDGLVNAGHWYDGIVLLTKTFSPMLGVDIHNGKPVFRAKNVERSFREQLAHIANEGAEAYGGPTLLGEYGIPYDLNDKVGYTEGDFSPHRAAMDRTFRALDANLMSGTVWNYTADNDNAHGDQWNGEDLSIFSKDQIHEFDDPHDLDAGGRAIGAFCRPYPRAIAGKPTFMNFDLETREFVFSFEHAAGINEPTEIFVPDYHYGIGLGVEISDGEVEYDQESQTLRWFHAFESQTHTIKLFREKGESEIETGILHTSADTESDQEIVLEHHFRETNGIKLHTVEAGPTEGDMVILLHGFPEFWYGWKEQIPFLVRQGYRVVVPDQRGYNQSDKPKRVADYHLDKLADDIVGLIDGFKREKVFLIGHDWGAVVTWWLAARNPEKFYRTMVLNVPHVDAVRNGWRTNPQQMRKSWYILAFQLPWLPEFLIPRTKILEGSSHDDTFTAEDLQKYQEAWARPGALTGMVNWYRALLWGRLQLQNPRVTIPMFIVFGANDIAITRKAMVQSLKYCDEGSIYFLEEATHWVQHDEPEKANQLIGRFLAAHFEGLEAG